MSSLLLEDIRKNAGVVETLELNEELLVEGLVFFKKSKRLKRLIAGLKKKMAKKPNKAGDQLIVDLESIAAFYKQLEDRYKFSKGDAKKEVKKMYRQSNTKFASYLKHLQQKEVKDLLIGVGALALVAATVLMILGAGPSLGGFMTTLKAKMGIGVAAQGAEGSVTAMGGYSGAGQAAHTAAAAEMTKNAAVDSTKSAVLGGASTGKAAEFAAKKGAALAGQSTGKAAEFAASKQGAIEAALNKSNIFTNINTPMDKVLTPATMNGLAKAKFMTPVDKEAFGVLKELSGGRYAANITK